MITAAISRTITSSARVKPLDLRMAEATGGPGARQRRDHGHVTPVGARLVTQLTDATQVRTSASARELAPPVVFAMGLNTTRLKFEPASTLKLSTCVVRLQLGLTMVFCSVATPATTV